MLVIVVLETIQLAVLTVLVAGLLREPDQVPWDRWSAPMSLRDVEPEVLLQLRRDDSSWQTAPPWDFSGTPTANGAGAP